MTKSRLIDYTTVFIAVMQHFLVVYHGILLKSLVSSCYTNKIQVKSGIFHGVPLESVA